MDELEAFVDEWDKSLRESVTIPEPTLKDLADRYAAGEQIQRLAADTGIPYSALRGAFHKEGVDKIARKPPSMTNAEAEEFATRYRAGESLRVLEASSRFSYSSIRAALNAAGVEMRSNGRERGKANVMPKHSVTNAEAEEFVTRYRAGESLRDLDASSRFSYTTIRRVLNAAGVEIRPRGRARGKANLK